MAVVRGADVAQVKDRAAVEVQVKDKVEEEAWDAAAADLAPAADASVPVAARLCHISKVSLALR